MQLRTILRIFMIAASLCGFPVRAQIPKLDYATYLGGSGADSGYAIATDNTGAIYVAGFTQSPDFPLLNPLQPYFGGGTRDLFVAKLNADASGFEYITYLGGSGGEGDPGGHVGGIAVDAQGNLYIAGLTRSSDFLTTPGAYQVTIASQYVCDDDPNAGLCGDAFVTKLNPQGKLVYSTFLGGSDYEDAKAIAVDASGCAYITGMTASPDFPTTSGAFQPDLRDVDAYIAKLSPDGSTLIYSTLLGGTGLDAGMGIAVDDQGRAFIVGTTQAADFPLKNALQNQFGDPWDAFVVRLNATGTDLEFSTFLGGSGTDEAFAVALNANSDIYVAGFTDSSDFPVANAFQPDYGSGDGNGFVTKLRSDGSAIAYATFLGGADGRSEINAIAVDPTGSAVVVGHGGSDFPIVNSVHPYAGSSDAILAKVTPDGSALYYSTFVGGSGSDVATAIAIDPYGRIVITGETSSADFTISHNASQLHFDGASDAFVVRLLETKASVPIFSSPKTLSVGQVYVGRSSAAKTLRITNPGSQPLHVTAIVSSSNVAATSDCATVATSGICSISASLSVSTIGNESGTITVFDDAPNSPQTILVRGTGVAGGDLELTQMVAGSRFTLYGKTAIPFTATVVNHGPNDSESVQIVPASNSGSFDCDPCYIGHIGSGKSAVLRFNFIPNQYGMLSVNARVEASGLTPDLNPGNDRQNVLVANPHYRIDPPQLTFASQIVGLSSAAQRTTFTSLDGNPLRLSLSTKGDFTGSISCDQRSLHCYADVTFGPTVAGLHAGTLIVTEASSATVDAIALSGSATLAPHLRLSTLALNFSQELRNGSSAPQVLSVANDGSAPLLIVSVSISSAFSQANDCPPFLAPGATCHVNVRFSPVASGLCRGSLTVIHNAAGLLNVVTLIGNGISVANLNRPSRPGTSTSAVSPNSAKTAAQVVTVKPRPPRPVARSITPKSELAR